MPAKKYADNTFCPLVKGECVKAACKFWVHVQGKDPQSGAIVDFPDCSIKWLPTLLIKSCLETSQVAASVDSSRNEAKKNAAALAIALVTSDKSKLVELCDDHLPALNSPNGG